MLNKIYSCLMYLDDQDKQCHHWQLSRNTSQIRPILLSDRLLGLCCFMLAEMGVLRLDICSHIADVP